MSGHGARIHEQPGGKWGAGCAQCGWSRLGYKSEAGALKGAARHDKEATALDHRAHMALYGNAEERAKARQAMGL